MGQIHNKVFTVVGIKRELENLLIALKIPLEDRMKKKYEILLQELAERNRIIEDTRKIINKMRKEKKI
jgi:hypothetical protein